MTEIITAERRFGHADLRQIAARFPSSTGDKTLPTDAVTLRRRVRAVARVNHGRWIADCPDPDCGGASFISFDNPFFFCCECRNGRVDHDLIPVEVPKPGLRGEIEDYLRARPVPRTRNWLPGESMVELRDENRAHNVLLLKEGS